MKSHPWRKIFRLGSRLTMAVLLISATSCSERETAGTDYTQFVNPLIGTGGHGHTFPGPVVPHGMVQPGPDTRLDGWDSCSGYYYNDSTINGFSHNRLSGTGCCDYGDVLLMPTVENSVSEQRNRLGSRCLIVRRFHMMMKWLCRDIIPFTSPVMVSVRS